MEERGLTGTEPIRITWGTPSLPIAGPGPPLCREARALGANAVVALRFDCNETGDIMSGVAAYDTSVTVEPLQPTADTNQR